MRDSRVRVAGAAMIALALWLLRYDLSWQSLTRIPQ